MSEDLKEDIINDINRLLSKESPMHGNVQENHHNQQMNELSPQAIAHMQKQMQQQQMQQQMEHQIPQMQQMPPMQQHMPSQMEQMNNVSPQMMAQLQQAQQQQMHKQLLQQQMAQQMQQAQLQTEEKPMPTPILKKQVVEHLDANNSSNSNSTLDGIKDLFFANRDALVLLLLFCVICTPQVNLLLNKIPNTSDIYSYPNYLGILLRGVLLVGTYLTLKKLNFI
jgi:DNA primase